MVWYIAQLTMFMAKESVSKRKWNFKTPHQNHNLAEPKLYNQNKKEKLPGVDDLNTGFHGRLGPVIGDRTGDTTEP